MAAETPAQSTFPLRTGFYLLPFAVAVVELLAHVRMRTTHPTQADYAAVAEVLRPRLGPRDQVLAAPSFTDPLVRAELGGVLGVARAGATDLAPFERLFVVSARGHRAPLQPARAPDVVTQVGQLDLLEYRLGPSPVLYDFVASFRDAQVEVVTDGVPVACPLRVLPPKGGGLGQGMYWPAERFACDPLRPWLWFAPTVNEDLDLTLRHCLLQHPSGPEPFRVTYPRVPLGEALVFEADIYYEQERMEAHGAVPFELRVKIDGEDVGTLRHVDGMGRARLVVDPRGRVGGRSGVGDVGAVTIETTSADNHLRSVCWSGTSRRTETR